MDDHNVMSMRFCRESVEAHIINNIEYEIIGDETRFAKIAQIVAEGALAEREGWRNYYRGATARCGFWASPVYYLEITRKDIDGQTC